MIIIYSTVILGILGLASGLFLAFAASKFAVKEDPRIKLAEAALPGINCGACGFPGCSGFAKAYIEGKVSKESCIPGKRSGVPAKLEAITKTPEEKIITIWEESGGDTEKALQNLLSASGATPKAAPKKPMRPSPEEAAKYKDMLKGSELATLIYGVLPNIDCGLCGHPGCAAFALKLASNEEKPEKCVPGARQNVPEKVAKIKKMSSDEIKKILEETAGDPKKIKEKLGG
ncbi:Fe-S cluster protein [Kosmotoga arenicorallina S304]|uniref:Fe-S cluster protein n=1 Tax=Kosmotoga arenicorallina S304 TaxID=1453497 RepID=A0A176K222_9BACT|nr:(Fe-S)-binding protein [Kosmotoga arenicorallina]OAA30975.1 Fe-S cluster protein [Kosmotoga arenicorallina S304]